MKTNKIIALILSFVFIFSLAACGSASAPAPAQAPSESAAEAVTETAVEPAEEVRSFTVGICNYVDDASLNQIVENIQNRLAEISAENGVEIKIDYDNCNADANVLEQIVQNFIADGVDLMVGVATPVAMTMQADTEENQIPVVFAAVSDPISTGIVA